MSTRHSQKKQAVIGNTWIKVVVVALIAASFSWLVSSASFHLGSVAPTQRLMLSEEAKSLAKEMDSQLKTRTAVITSLVHDWTLEKLLATSGVERFSNAIQGQFSDYLSLEVLNANGEVLAMLGELSLSQADLSPKDAGENAFRKDQRSSFTGIFRDDPLNGCFFLTCRHRNGDGTYWYSRTRFTRKSIEGLLSEFGSRAALVRISGGKQDLEVVYGHPTRTYGSWWSGPEYAEATLESPGWLVKVTTEEKRPLLWRTSIVFPGVVLALTMIGVLFGRRFLAREQWENAVLGSAVAAPNENLISTSDAVNGISPAHRAIHERRLTEQNESFEIDSESDFSPLKDEAASSEAANDDCFKQGELNFDSAADEFATGSSSPSIAVQDLPGDSAQLEAEEGSSEEFVVESSEEGALLVQGTSQPADQEESLLVAEDDVIEVLWEGESEPTVFQIAAEGKLLPEAASDADQMNAEALPDVLELEWDEPEAQQVPQPEKKQPREKVLLADFFNC